MIQAVYNRIILYSLLLGIPCVTYVTYSLITQQTIHTYKAVIFDLDSTIINTDLWYKQATLISLETYASLQDDTIFAIKQACTNLNRYETIQYCINYLDQHSHLRLSMHNVFEKLLPYLADIYRQQKIHFFPHFYEFYQTIEEKKLKTAIATSGHGYMINIVNNMLDIKSLLGNHIYHTDYVHHAYKSHPDVYLYAAQYLNAQPHEYIAIQDSEHGIQAAKSTGMYCIAINTSHNQKRLHQANMIVDSYLDSNIDKI